MKIGDNVVLVHDWVNPQSVTEEVIQSIGNGTVTLKGHTANSPRIYYTPHVFPIEYKKQILDIIHKRKALKVAFDDSMSLVYEFCNQVSRDGKK